MLAINFSKDAEKFLRQLPPKHGRQIASKLQQMLENPSPNDSKQLRGYPYLRVDAGEYRIIYFATEEILEIVLIGKRNDDDVYKRLRRK